MAEMLTQLFKGCGIKKLCLVKWNWVLQDVTEQLTIHC